MVFRTGTTTKGTTMPSTTPKMPPDSTCLLCCSGLKKTVPGNIAVFEQQLSFTQRQAIDVLVEVLNTKESALTRSRWMCAHCYAQLELLDKYERDRRQLEQKATTIQAELMSTFLGTIDPASSISPAPTPATTPRSSAAPVSSVVSSSSVVMAKTTATSVAKATTPSSTADDKDDDGEPKSKRPRRSPVKSEPKTDTNHDGIDGGGNSDTESDDGHDASDPIGGDLRNGNDSENESDYVEINVASIAAGATSPFHAGSENGDLPSSALPREDGGEDGEDEDDPAAEEEDGASDQDEELYPLAGEMVDVKQELAGSDVSDCDMDEDVPASDPLADGFDPDDPDDVSGSDTPVVNVALLQNTLRTRLRSRLKPGGVLPPPAAPRASPKLLPVSATPASTSGGVAKTSTGQPVHVSVCVVQPRSAGLKTLLPKPGPGQPAPKPKAPVSPAAVAAKSKPSQPAPVVKVSSLSSLSSPVVSVASSVTSVAGNAALPVLLQGADGKLYMLPTGTQPAVSAAGGATGAPVTLLRLPDGRLVMPGPGTQVTGGTVQTPLMSSRPQPPILPAGGGGASSTLKNILMTGGSIMGERGGAAQKPASKQRKAGRNYVILPETARPQARGPILESILQRQGTGSEPCPLCSLIFSSAAEVDQHLRNHSMVCSGCDHLFASRVALFEHRQNCVPSRPPPLPTPPPLTGNGRNRPALCCNLCPAVAPDTAGLNEHAAQVHGLLYRCPKCDCRTAELLQYAHHVRSAHAIDVPHPCNLCQTSFLRSEQREMHVRESHGPPTTLGDRPHVKDRTIDGVRLPKLLGKPVTPPPAQTQDKEKDGEETEKDDTAKEKEGDGESSPAQQSGDEESAASGMLIVKEETDLLL